MDVRGTPVDLEELRAVPLFSGMPDDELERLLREGSEKRVARGEENGREGEPVEDLYVILDGELRITKKVEGGEVTINTYGPGTFFAEVPLLAGTPFLASGRALTDCRLFLVPDATFRRLLTSCPTFSETILETMADRVRILQSVAQQRERLDSLGTLAAGLAHELNNPASASLRAVNRLGDGLEVQRGLGMELARAAASGSVGPEDLDAIERFVRRAAGHAARARDEAAPDVLEESDLEAEVAFWLEENGLDAEASWEVAETLAAARVGDDWLETEASGIAPNLLPSALRYLGAALDAEATLDEARSGTARVSALVGAMKSYSYMDEAPLQEVDVREGLEDTLKVLGYRLEGIEVECEYDPKLPRITAYGGELNQAWTQLIDNAIDAARGGGGNVRVRATCEADRVMVEVADDGPGIPEELQTRVFEPFYTTKDVGAGAGLGLDVSYRIIVGRHGGDIRVVSQPGDTRFQVRVPMQAPESPEPVLDTPDGHVRAGT